MHFQKRKTSSQLTGGYEYSVIICRYIIEAILVKRDNFEKQIKKLNSEGYTEAHSALFYTSEKEPFAKIVNALSC